MDKATITTTKILILEALNSDLQKAKQRLLMEIRLLLPKVGEGIKSIEHNGTIGTYTVSNGQLNPFIGFVTIDELPIESLAELLEQLLLD